MKILQIIPDLGTGGAERMMTLLACELARRRHEVGVLSLFTPDGTAFEPQLRAAGVRVFSLGKKLGFDARMLLATSRVLREFRPEIAHTHRYVLAYALPALLLARCRTVHTVHNLAGREVGRAGRVVHRAAFRLGVTPVAIGDVVRESVERTYGRPVPVVIPNGIPVQAYRRAAERERWRRAEGVGDGEVLFGCVARLEPQKNLALLLDAFASLAVPGARLFIAGQGPDRAALEDKVAKLGLGSRVRFLGARSDVPAFLAASDVFVLSSLWEGNPLSVMEAMAAGKPVIATSVGGVPELVTDGVTGLLVRPGDAPALASAMATLATDGAARARMGQAAAARAAERFSVEAMADGYETLYANLLG